MNTKNNIRHLCITTIGFLIHIYFIRLLNKLAFYVSEGPELIILYIMIQWTIPCIIILLLKKEGKHIADLGFSNNHYLRQIINGCLLALILVIAIYIIPDFISGKPIIYPEIHFSIMNVLYYILGVSAAEEILVRGYLYTKLYEIKESYCFAAIVSSLIFGFYHIYGGNIHQMINATICGIILCVFRLKVKNCTLLSLILAHGIYGTLGIQIFTAF